jgi:hypothetical protein
MSISSILAFVAAGVAAKVKSGQVARPSEDRIAELEARIAELEDDIAAANDQARRDQDLIDMWRERALYAVPAGAAVPARPPDVAALPPDVAALQQQAAAYHNQAALAQYQGLQNHAAQNAQAFYGQGLGALLGAQSLIDAELFCNCVPSRSQVWATSEPE